MSSLDTLHVFPCDVQVIELESSNDTADDLPGAGRLLGKFYQVTGQYLERAINALAKRSVHGPRVIAKRIQLRHWDHEYARATTQHEKEQRKDFKKLISYTK